MARIEREPYSADELMEFADDVVRNMGRRPAADLLVEMLPVILRVLADLVCRGER